MSANNWAGVFKIRERDEKQLEKGDKHHGDWETSHVWLGLPSNKQRRKVCLLLIKTQKKS